MPQNPVVVVVVVVVVGVLFFIETMICEASLCTRLPVAESWQRCVGDIAAEVFSNTYFGVSY